MCSVQKDEILRHFLAVNSEKYFSILEAETYDNKFVHDGSGHFETELFCFGCFGKLSLWV